MSRSRASRASRRVSSAATRSAPASTPRIRPEASPGLPNGAPTSTSRPSSTESPYGCPARGSRPTIAGVTTALASEAELPAPGSDPVPGPERLSELTRRPVDDPRRPGVRPGPYRAAGHLPDVLHPGRVRLPGRGPRPAAAALATGVGGGPGAAAVRRTVVAAGQRRDDRLRDVGQVERAVVHRALRRPDAGLGGRCPAQCRAPGLV